MISQAVKYFLAEWIKFRSLDRNGDASDLLFNSISSSRYCCAVFVKFIAEWKDIIQALCDTATVLFLPSRGLNIVPQTTILINVPYLVHHQCHYALQPKDECCGMSAMVVRTYGVIIHVSDKI